MVRLEDFKVGEIKKMISKYNKEVKITTSGLRKADLIKKIREHPRLTVTESDKGVSIKVNSQATMGGKKIKIKKDEKPEEKPAEKPEEKPAAEDTKPKAQLGQSGIGNKRKREPPKPKKKKVIDVYVKPNEKEEKPKPKVPTITVTEEEKPKKKVIKRGGRFITVKPKEPKADLPPIPKSKNKIRLPKEESKSIGDLLKENNLTFKSYNKEAQIVYDKETNKNASNVQEVKLSSNKRDLFVTTINPQGEKRKRVLALKEIGEKNIKKSKAEVAKDLKKIQNKPTKESKGGAAAEKEEKKLPKFKKTETLPEASVEQLEGMIAYQKKQGNDAVVKQLEKELKEFKGKGKAKKLSEFTKEEVEEKYKDLGEFQKANNKILDRAQFILTKDKNKIDKMIEIYKKINVQGKKGVSSNFNQVRSAIREKLERDQNNCESLINSLRTKINFIKKNSSCLNKKQLEEIKNLGIVTKTYYNNLTDTIKEEKEVKDEFLKLYTAKK